MVDITFAQNCKSCAGMQQWKLIGINSIMISETLLISINFINLYCLLIDQVLLLASQVMNALLQIEELNCDRKPQVISRK